MFDRYEHHHQSKKMSFVEALTNTLVGLLLAFVVNAVLMYWTGVTATWQQNALIVAGHTIVSVVRGYMVRRLFNGAWRLWWNRLRCKHKTGKLVSIEWDGCSLWQCDGCGKMIAKGLE